MHSFFNVAGHKNAKKLLTSAINNKKIAHGYLFIGAKGLGKFKLAKEFIKSLLCKKGLPGNPCGKCEKCFAIENEAEPDVLFINSAKSKLLIKSEDRKDSISIDQIRKLEHHLSLYPYNSEYKIVIVDEAHKLTNDAINAFLKTLEEPKGNTIIILIADSGKFLLKTLISRTQVIRFWPTRGKVIRDFLANQGCDEEKADRISRIASGLPGLAVILSQDAKKEKEYFDKERDFWKFIRADMPNKMFFLENLVGKEENISEVLGFWAQCARRKILNDYLLNKSIANLFAGSEFCELVSFANHLNSVLNLINSSNINKRLALEVLALEI